MGTSRSDKQNRRGKRDHPHAYGDKTSEVLSFQFPRGSSPRVWGQVFVAAERLPVFRIIPTRMGTSYTFHRNNLSCRDHPHAYGDKRCQNGIFGLTLGSSPRVWGQDILCRERYRFFGIIPTRVGTRNYAANAYKTAGDHPHACGDKDLISVLCRFTAGSSPRVWGQVRRCGIVPLKFGIIPTRVGTSGFSSSNTSRSKDHPHACGDKSSHTS